MSDDHHTPQPAPPQITIRSPEHKIVYSDTFSLKVTSVDLTMIFGVQSAVPVFNQNTGMSAIVNANIEQFSVAMPLSTFKSLTEHMTKIVEVIESEIGHVRIPTNSRLSPEHVEMIRHNLRNNPLA